MPCFHDRSFWKLMTNFSIENIVDTQENLFTMSTHNLIYFWGSITKQFLAMKMLLPSTLYKKSQLTFLLPWNSKSISTLKRTIIPHFKYQSYIFCDHDSSRVDPDSSLFIYMLYLYKITSSPRLSFLKAKLFLYITCLPNCRQYI